MQFGFMSVSDITRDPVTGRTPSEYERIRAIVTIAKHADQAGLDVFALGEHHNVPFFSSSPSTTLAYIAAQTENILLSTSTTLITTNDPVKIAEDFAMLQHLTDGRMDIMLGRGNTGPVYPWFGKDIRQGIELAVENYALLRRLWDEEVVDWQGRFRTPLRGFTSTPRPLDGVPPFVWHGSIRSPEVAEQAAYYGDGFFSNNIFWPASHTRKMVQLYRQRFAHYGHGRPEDAIVGLGGQFYLAKNSQDAIKQFRPYFDNAPVYGHGPSLEEYMARTPLSVGSPQEVIDRTLGFREVVGDYQRQLFLIDHAGMPLDQVLRQIDIFAEDVLPVLRRETEERRAEGTPQPPTHERLVAAARAETQDAGATQDGTEGAAAGQASDAAAGGAGANAEAADGAGANAATTGSAGANAPAADGAGANAEAADGADGAVANAEGDAGVREPAGGTGDGRAADSSADDATARAGAKAADGASAEGATSGGKASPASNKTAASSKTAASLASPVRGVDDVTGKSIYESRGADEAVEHVHTLIAGAEKGAEQ